MGIAQTYKQHIDTGLAFSEEQIAAFSIQGWASVRVEELASRLLVVQRLETMDVPKFVWWKEVSQRLSQVIGWYCVAMTIQTPLPLLPPQPRTKEGRELASRANKLDPERWIDGFGTDALVQLQHVATLGQACLISPTNDWGKPENKLLNRLLNCITSERHLAEKFSASLAARQSRAD